MVGRTGDASPVSPAVATPLQSAGARLYQCAECICLCVCVCVCVSVCLQGPKSALLGSSFEFTVQLSSPMLISLTRCHWMIEALGLLNAIKIPQPYVYTLLLA